MGRDASSKRWLQRHVSDAYVRKAKTQGYRSRAAYKLLEIDALEGLFRPGRRVLDLGAAPGGWSQVASGRVSKTGTVVAVDLQAIDPISGVTTLSGDVRERGFRAELVQALGGQADVVLSDLSPNMSGIAGVDQARAGELVLLAQQLASEVLTAKGIFVVKLFQGEAFDEIMDSLRAAFEIVAVRKPAASRGESRETFAVARSPKPVIRNTV